jgi:sporulation protein YlmC with PRC-barrel domain
MPDPVAWTTVERGWKVVDASGEEFGHVSEVQGDPNMGIFHGLLVQRGLFGGTEYVPAEQVSEIREGEVVLTG